MSAIFSAAEHRYMAHALRLAQRGLFTTDPNPRVGCVLVREGQVVGEGWHRKAGEPHAERFALEQAGASARGATAYVTLEPCAHQGRTPPCTDGLIEAGVARVVAAMTDPNPRVAGKGLIRLAEAGIETALGLLETEAARLNPGFLQRMRHGRPFVRCKMAMSLDGRTAMANGESRWITGEAARRDVQLLRARSSAVMTGIGTVLVDDPSLNLRLPADALHGVGHADYFRQPLRVVLDTHLRTPPHSRLLALPGDCLILCGAMTVSEAEPALVATGAEVIRLPLLGERLDLERVLDVLADRGVNELHVESGPTLSGSLLRSGLVDEMVIYMAPHLMGDAARGLVCLPGLEQMDQRIELRLCDLRQVGRDLRLTYQPQVRSSGG